MNYQAVGHQDGLISCNSITFTTVHGLYQDIYAFRDKLTEVVVQRLNSSVMDDYEDETSAKICIRCNDLVKKISVYKDKLAVSVVVLSQCKILSVAHEE